jgi:hypothetical protein
MGHAETPPQLPEITDEAGNTPRWVPLLGAGLFALAILAIVLQHSGSGNDSEATSDQAAEAAAP